MTWSPGKPPSSSSFVAREASSFVKLSTESCRHVFATDPCRAVAGVDANAIVFDHTTCYLTRGAGLTGAADSKLGTVSCWVRTDGTLGGRLITVSDTLATDDVDTRIVLNASNAFVLGALNAAGTVILDIRSSPIPTDGRWHHLLASFDLSNAAKRHIYIDGSEDLDAVTTYTDDAIDFTKADWSIGAYAGGGSKYGGRVAELWFAPGVYLDLSVAANREKFRSSLGYAVDLGATGELPTGTAPLIYLSGSTTNLGTGGAFTEHGTFTTADFTTGSQKCFNTRATCMDTEHFDVVDLPAVPEYVSAGSSGSGSSASYGTMSMGAVAPAGSVRTVAVVFNAVGSAGAVTLTSVTIGGVVGTIRSQVSSGKALSAIIDFDDVSGTTAAVSAVFSGSVAWSTVHIYRMLDVEFAEGSKTSTTITAPSVTYSSQGDHDIILSGIASDLMSSTAWTGATESDDNSTSTGHYTAAWYQNDASELAKTISGALTYAARTAPTLVTTAALTAGDSGPIFATIAGLAANDIALAVIETDAGVTATAPSGWAHVTGSPFAGGSGNLAHVLWTRATGTSIAGAEFTLSSSNHKIGVIAVFRGCISTGNPWNAIASSGGSDVSGTAPSVTTTIANSLIVNLATHWNDSASDYFSGWTNANLASITEAIDDSTNTGNGGGAAIAYGVKSAAGASGTTSFNLLASAAYTSVTMALIPTDNSDSVNAMASARYSFSFAEAETELDLLFAKSSEHRPQDIDAIPSIANIDFSPARIDPGESLGTRSTLRVRFKDQPHSDAGIDPYYADRDYNPYEQGSFWPRFRARQPYLRNEALTWYQGFVGDTLNDMESRHYVIETFDGPTVDGHYTLIAHDPLKMLDGDRAQCPAVSEGAILADMTNVATTFTITPTAVADDYPSSGYVAVGGREVMSYTRSGTTFTVTRAQMNTTAVAHTAQDRVQLVKVFSSLDAADILYDLFVNYAGVPAAWINLPEWQAETAAYLRRNFSARIAEPTPINRLASEIMQQCGLSVWWDDESQKFRLRVLRPISTDTDTFSSTLFIRGSIDIREQPDKRFSEVWISYGQINPLKPVEDRDNYRNHIVTADLTATRNYGSPKIKKIYSRWIAEGGSSAATRIGNLQLSRYNRPPRLFTFSLMRGAQGNPLLGEGYLVGHRILQGADGSAITVPSQAVQIRPKPEGFDVALEEFDFTSESEEDLADRTITINASTYDVNAREWHNDSYPNPRTGDNVTFIINSDIVVGSTSTSIPAFDVGTWPTQAMTGNRTSGSPIISGLNIVATDLLVAGLRISGTGIPTGAKILTVDGADQITLTVNASSGAATSTALTVALVNVEIVNHGTISGKGGDGGEGANEDTSSAGTNGEAGGLGFYSRYMCGLDNTDGTIQGGGGGGGGGSCADLDNHRGGGGGGGAGSVPGAAGIGPGNGEDGQAGTLLAGGAYGRSYTSSVFWSPPRLKDGIHGGNGGAPGTAGQDEVGDYDIDGGSGGAAGQSIDGVSYCITVGSSGTRTGAQVN